MGSGRVRLREVWPQACACAALAGWLVGALVLVGCSSPGDVQAIHDDAVRKADQAYASGMPVAQDWSAQRVLGIPASGWVAILIGAAILVFVLLVLAGVWAWKRGEQRATDAAALERQREQTRLERVRRGPCAVCGASAIEATNEPTGSGS